MEPPVQPPVAKNDGSRSWMILAIPPLMALALAAGVYVNAGSVAPVIRDRTLASSSQDPWRQLNGWSVNSHMVGAVPVIAIDNFLPEVLAEKLHTELYQGWNTSEWLYTTNVPNTNQKVRSRDQIAERRKVVLEALARDPNVFAYSKWELKRSARVFKQLRAFMEEAQEQIAAELQVTQVKSHAGESKKRFGLTGWYMDSTDEKDETFMAEFKKMQSATTD